MIIQKAKINDIESIMLMYSSCVKGMLLSGNNQWDETYPNSEIILKDINNETYYIAIKNKEIVAGINIDKNQDKKYIPIDWKDKSNNFLVVHRLGIKHKYWSGGIGKQLMLFVESLALEQGCNSIRLDTYSQNESATQFYLKIGYNKLGSINLKPKKDVYYCFEKSIGS